VTNSLRHSEAEKAAAETLGLPIYPELTVAQQRCVVEIIKQFYEKTSLEVSSPSDASAARVLSPFSALFS